MKIGIITFHWATNYGAVLQSYALLTYLTKMGHDVKIINYRPRQYRKSIFSSFLTRRPRVLLQNIKDLFKERKIELFRAKYLNETLLYSSLAELQKRPPQFDIYICGSDQIWNPNFTQNGEGQLTSTYYLNFGNENIKRIAYAVSFGCETYPKLVADFAKNYTSKFQYVSVRENTGLKIANLIGCNHPVLLPDPTLLLTKEDYSYSKKTNTESKSAYLYFLRTEQKEHKRLINYLKRKYKISSSSNFLKSDSIEEWVNNIKNATLVVTNSYHGMLFSIIFHVPFLVLYASGHSSGMNDRFKTILSLLDMEERAIENFNIDTIEELISKEIVWKNIDEKISQLRLKADNYLNNFLD